MTREFFKNLAVCFIVGAIMTGCAKKGSTEEYIVKKPDLSFEWQYPAGWEAREFGEPRLGFSGVTFFEKKQPDKDYEASFVVVAKKAAMFHLKETTLSSVARDAAVKVLRFEGARILKRETLQVADQKAEKIDAAYIGASDIYSPAAKKVALREIIIIVARGERFYTIRYVNKEDDFAALEPLFQRAVKTFRFTPLDKKAV